LPVGPMQTISQVQGMLYTPVLKGYTILKGPQRMLFPWWDT
jgi:hypothetical protein